MFRLFKPTPKQIQQVTEQVVDLMYPITNVTFQFGLQAIALKEFARTCPTASEQPFQGLTRAINRQDYVPGLTVKP